MTKPRVVNGDDPLEVKRAEDRERVLKLQKTEDAVFVMSSVQGRRFVHELISHCKPFNSIWESSAKIHYNAGKQDVGHFIMDYVETADPDNYIKMLMEAKKERMNV